MKVLLDLDGMYPRPACRLCDGCATEAIYILDEDESRLIAVQDAGVCLGCSTLIVDDPKRAVEVR